MSVCSCAQQVNQRSGRDELVVGAAFQRLDIRNRDDVAHRPCRDHGAGIQYQWIAAYMIFSSVASRAENSSTTFP
jgi:hypothetical protein